MTSEELGFDIVVKTMHGLEDVLAGEIRDLGGKDIRIERRAVVFRGNQELLYKSNYYLRTALKVLKPLTTFKARNEVELYKGAAEYNWESIIDRGDTIAIDPVVHSDNFNHSIFVAQKTKDAIVDQLRKSTGRRPSVDLTDPTIRINVHLAGDICTILLDSSGESLHKRGYRIDGHVAPLNEVLAAGLIMRSGWKADCDFLDLMCGSGTLPIEAALFARNIPPGIFRSEFAFEKWHDYDENLYNQIVEDYQEREFQFKIIGSDNELKSVSLARANVKNASLSKFIEIEHKDMFDFQPHSESGIIIINPPYGERIKKDNLERFYKRIGDKLKTNFSGYTAWILTSNKEAMKMFGLHPSQKIQVFNGKLECLFNRYNLYKGSIKRKYQNDRPQKWAKR